MKTLADRFRRWYEYERACNARSLEMLASVPEDRRGDPAFAKAVAKMAHLVAARRRWLNRLGELSDAPSTPFPQVALADLLAQVADTEAAWARYLDKLDLDPAEAAEVSARTRSAGKAECGRSMMVSRPVLRGLENDSIEIGNITKQKEI